MPKLVKAIKIGIADDGQIFISSQGCRREAEVAGLLRRVADVHAKRIQARENEAPKIIMPWQTPRRP